jgi:hypothetical protein
MRDALAPDVAEQLLDLRGPDGGRHTAVTALLVAAAGPALPGELTGEESALRGFRLVYRPLRRRRAGLIAVAALVTLSLGGTAYAAGADHLPGPVQRTVDSLFGGGGAGPAPPVAPRTGGPQPGPPAGSSPAAVPDGVQTDRVEQLCRAWAVARADPHAPQVTGEDRRALAHAAHGTHGIDGYCGGVLAGRSPSTPAATATATAAPGQQGTAPGQQGLALGQQRTAKPGNTDPGGGASRTHPAKPAHR